jgi:hypothetical protein
MSTFKLGQGSYEFLDDGTVRIHYFDEVGYVSSAHLIEQKLNQLEAAHAKKKVRGAGEPVRRTATP